MWATLLQLEGVVVKANALISWVAARSQSLNSTLSLSSFIKSLPVTKACAVISLQSSNLGFKCAISGFWTNASLSSGLNKPVDLKFFSITEDIRLPNSFIFTSS